MKKFSLILGLLILPMLVGATEPLQIDPRGQIILSPAKSEVVLSPGQTRTERFKLINQTPNSVIVSVGAEELASEIYSVLPYLYFTERQFILLPGETHEVPVTIALPKSIVPGGFYGTVIFSLSAAQPEAGKNARVVTRLGSLLFVRVHGAVVTEGKLLGISFADKNFLINFNNSGSIYLNPYGQLAIKPILLGREKILLIEPWYVLPQTSRVREIESPKLSPGFYRAQVSLNRGYSDIIDEASLVFAVWSPLLLAAVVVALLVIVALLVMLKWRFFVLILFFALTTPVYGLLLSSAKAEVASSTNYQIQTDSLNFAGNQSSSTNYALGDTEGEIGTSTSTSATYGLRAGYRPMLEAYLAVSAPSNVTMSPAVDGSGDTSLGEVAWRVTTDSPSGYTLTIKAAASPALAASGGSFTDYTPAGAVPDYVWSIAASDSEFGFSPEGSHVATRYLDNGSACGTGASETVNSCWDGFSTTNLTIASSTSSNIPNGTVTTVKLQAATGSSKTQTAGSYSATLTVTALVQ